MRISQISAAAMFALSAVIITSGVGIATSVSAHGWPYHSLDEPVGRVKGYLTETKDYLTRTYDKVRYRLNGQSDDEGVLVLKLGLGIPFCKAHAATIGVRDGKYFRAVARARTLRGVRARNIGLMAATLPAGTYYIVHSRCNVRGRVHNVGLPVRRINGRRVEAGLHLFRTSYAKVTVEAGSVTNAGFLRFFPLRRGRLKIKLQRIPRGDLRFLAARYPDLSDDLELRLMARTNAAGKVLRARRPTRKRAAPVRSKAAIRKARATSPAKTRQSRPKSYAPPLIRMPKATPETALGSDDALSGVRTLPSGSARNSGTGATSISGEANTAGLPAGTAARGSDTLDNRVNTRTSRSKAPSSTTSPARSSGNPGGSSSNSGMTPAQRRAACAALFKLKRAGKLSEVPVSCLRFGQRNTTRKSNGLPPAIGKDK